MSAGSNLFPTNPAQGMTFSQLAQQQFNQAYNQYAQQQAAKQHNNMLSQQQILTQYAPKLFRINGVDMDLTEFLTALYPEDCAERTYLALKLTQGNQNE